MVDFAASSLPNLTYHQYRPVKTGTQTMAEKNIYDASSLSFPWSGRSD